MRTFAVGVLVVLTMSVVTFAGEAVSGLNGKAGYSYGNVNSETGKNLFGSFSLPLGQHLGFQADGMYTRLARRNFAGAGAHLFWRDPNKALIGLTGGYIDEQYISSYQGGIEAEWYLDKFSLGLQAGWADISYRTGRTPFIDTETSRFYGTGELGYYLLSDLKVSAAYTHAFDNNFLQALVEYQTPVPGLAFYADVAHGEHGYEHALIGLRFYFGKNKSLRLRHRGDDPQNIMPSILYGIRSYDTEYHKRQSDHRQSERIQQQSSNTTTVPGGPTIGYDVEGDTLTITITDSDGGTTDLTYNLY